MSTCEINIKNGTPVVKTYPKLMQEIMVFTKFDIDQALDLYGTVLTDEFKAMDIKNPTLKNIMAFIEQDYVTDNEPLTAEERNNLLNISLHSDRIENFKDRLVEAFTVNGMFGIDVEKLRQSNLFSDSDILEMEDVSVVDKLKDLYYKLSNTNEDFENIPTDFNLKNSLFDKQNPDLVLQNLYNNYAGLSTEKAIRDKAAEIGDEVVLNNMDLIPKILSKVKDKQLLPQYETDEYSGEVVLKEANNIQTALEQTFDISQNVSPLLRQLEFLRELPAEYYVSELPYIQRYIENIEIQAAEAGVNLITLSENMSNKTYEQVLDLLDTFYNFLRDVQAENVDSIGESMQIFSEVHNEFFGTTPQYMKTAVDKLNNNGVYLHLETNRTEEDLFTKHSLIKVSPGIYQKINNNKTLNELYDYLATNPEILPKNVLSVSNLEVNRDLMMEDIDKHISNMAKEYLSETSNVEDVKKIVAYKILTGIKPDTFKDTVTGFKNINVHQFLIDFNKEMLSNPVLRDIFYISNRGLEAKRMIGEFTNRQIKNELPQQMYDDLTQYAKVSGNSSLTYLAEQGSEIEDENLRDYYSNNMNQLPQHNQNYTKNGDYVVTNSNEEFIKINSELYENVAPNVYGKVERNNRYRNYNLVKPVYNREVTPDIKMQDGGAIKIKRVNNLKDSDIEFC